MNQQHVSRTLDQIVAKIEELPEKPLTDEQLEGIVGGAEGYSVKCKQKREIQSPQNITIAPKPKP